MTQIPLPLFSQENDDEAEDLTLDDPTIDAENAAWGRNRRTVKAAEVAPLALQAPASIWAMARAASESMRKHGRFGAASGFADAPPAKARPTVVQADPGVTRVQGSRYPANRWTDEREEQEKARRARQRPPKPVRKARTRGKKLLDLIGLDGNEE